MNKTTEVGNKAELKSPPRRRFVKGMVGFGAAFASSSLSSVAVSAQDHSRRPAPPGNEISPAQGGWGPIASSSGAGRYLQIEYPPSSTAGELQLGVTYTLWIPDGIQTVRALIVHQHGASIPAAQAGATSAYDLHWQALAKKWNCALLGPSYHVLNDAIDLTPGGAELWFDPRLGSDRVFLRALDEFAAKSGHAEIATVPWCLWGHSGGGIWANVMSMLHPERVLAAFLRSGTAVMFRPKQEFVQPTVPHAVYEIPTMVNFGVGERGNGPWDGSIAAFQEYRAQGAPIGLAPDPRTAHWCGDSRYLAIPFFDACLHMRLSDWPKILKPVDLSSAWLATPFGDTAVPAAEFKGDPKKAVWLPNAAVARIWMEYVRTGTVTDASAPPAPVNVRMKMDANKGNEITWDTGGEYGERAWRLCRESGWTRNRKASNASAGSGVWTPALPGTVISRHPRRSASANGVCRYLGQGRRQARLHCYCLERCGCAFSTLCPCNYSLNEESRRAER